MKLQLLGPSGADRYDDNSSQLTQNWFPHIAQGGKSKLALYPTPGETLFTDIGTGPIRGEINYNGLYFIVSGNEFYEVDAAGNGISRGTLNTSIGICKLDHNGANNGKQICIVDGTNGYIYNSEYQTFHQNTQLAAGTSDGATATTTLEDTVLTPFTDNMVGMIVYNTTDSTKSTITAVTDSDTLTTADSIWTSGDTYEIGSDAFPDGATHVEFMDGFFIWNNPASSGQFTKSKAYDGTDIDALDFATAERSPDELQGHLKVDRILWLVGTTTAEGWHNSGAADFPYEPIPAGFSEWGTVAPYSLVETAGLGFWVSQNEEGNGMIVMVQGLQVKIISTPEIAAELEAMDDLSDCYSFTYQAYQHTFVAFTFPSAQKTLVFDTTEKMWHTWSSKTLGYHRSTGHTFIYNKHLVGDPTNGRIYCLDYDEYTDNGDLITRIRRSVVFHAEEKGMDWQGVGIDIKEGVGDATTPDPQLHLRWRDENGAWSNYHSRSMGMIGERNKKLRWRQVGHSDSSRVYEIVVSDPVPAVLLDGYANIKTSDKAMS